MTTPALSIIRADVRGAGVDLVVIGVVKGSDGVRVATSDPEFESLDSVLAEVGVTGAPDEVRRLPAQNGIPVALVGLGSGPVTIDNLRSAAGTASRQLTGVERIAYALPITTAAEAAAVLEGAGIGAYAYLDYRVTSRESTKTPASEVTVLVPSDVVIDADALVSRATAVSIAVHTTRDLVNAPPSDLYPESLANAAVELAHGLPVDVEIMDEAELSAGGFGGILGVGSGSTRGPRMVTIRYAPKAARAHLALVGKGITFDSGGLSIKPAASMVGMKYDMTGSATVLAVTLAAARLNLPVRITARLCLAENMPSGSAIRPNDVLRMRGGTTVEVLNTDAEGRLVLADGIVAASEERPDAIIDVATLTGAARTAMGERVIPVMGDDALSRQLIDAGAGAGETLWRMPLPAELRTMLDSEIADIANGRPSQPAGGMLVAALFLQHFVGAVSDDPDAARIPWAHLDIAGAANNAGSPYGMNGKGPTGATVRTLLALTEVFSRP